MYLVFSILGSAVAYYLMHSIVVDCLLIKFEMSKKKNVMPRWHYPLPYLSLFTCFYVSLFYLNFHFQFDSGKLTLEQVIVTCTLKFHVKQKKRKTRSYLNFKELNKPFNMDPQKSYIICTKHITFFTSQTNLRLL